MTEWIFKVVIKAEGADVEQAQDKVLAVLAVADESYEASALSEAPYILSYESEDGDISG